MELGLSNTLLASDPRLVDHIMGEVKSQGIFDQFRKECIADVDTKPAYQNLRTRVEGSVNSFLGKQPWKPDLNKNQLRETLRKHIHEAPYLDAGVERIVDQVVNPKVYSVFMPQIEDVVYTFLGIERPKTKEKNGACGLKDLLPKDLDPVSPESDKNSLKDVSLESIDAVEELEAKKDEKSFNGQKLQEDVCTEKGLDSGSDNGQISLEERTLDEASKSYKTGSSLNLNTSGKSDDKTEEDEEDSPTFEPIDIMNLNESNISNDSHLSGISELTSHRSRSPDFCNELSRDNFDYSNADSQLSKVSSDSRLSIVTDFGSSNNVSTPLQDLQKDEANNDKIDPKVAKDNFKVIREFESNKNKSSKNITELNKNKDGLDSKNLKNCLFPKETSRDAVDSALKDKYEHKNNKDKSKDSESKSKSKDKNSLKDVKHHREKSDDKKKQRSHSNVKDDKSDRTKTKDKNDQIKENVERIKDVESSKNNSNKLKDDKVKETEKKESNNKEVKDLKDLYKEKIRELREKKELTEKEKLNKDSKEGKLNKETKDKKDSPKDKKPYKKDHKSSSSKNSSMTSHSLEIKNIKISDKIPDGKERKSESRDKNKRDDKRNSKDIKSKNHVSSKTDPTEKSDKQDIKKFSKNDKEDKTDKLEVKKDIRSNTDKNSKKDGKIHVQSKNVNRNEKVDTRRDSKNDLQTKEKKRRDDKKSKSKDDHSSLRKNSNDRRSTDRDGSNGSSSKSSQASNSSSNASSSKSGASSLSKESSHISNSNSETSDSLEEAHTNVLNLALEQSTYKWDKLSPDIYNEYNIAENTNNKVYIREESEPNETNLPLKKRPLLNEDNTVTDELKVKKPKFAKNIHEAKKLMKIRKQIEKQKLKENKKMEKKLQQKLEQPIQLNTANNTDNFESVPDEERVQIIEIPDEEYEEPYPEKHTNLTLEERSIIMLETEAGAKDLLQTHSNLKLKLSDMELCIKQSLSETLPTKKLEVITRDTNSNIQTTDLDNHLPSTVMEGIKDNTLHSEKEETTMQTCSTVKQIQQDANTFKIQEEAQQRTDMHDSKTLKNENDEAAEQPVIINEDHRNQTNYENILIPAMSAKETEDNQNLNAIECTTEESNTIISKNECTDNESTLPIIEDNEDCRYFKTDNEKSERFANFLDSLELVENTSLEDIIECLGGQIVSSVSKAMAPPLPKRKHSSSPLTDILLNNSNNNNDSHKKALNTSNEDTLNSMKKTKLIAPKKQRLQANLCTPPGLLNGENFVMPLSPESDVSATSEKLPLSNVIKEDKSRHRSSQRYSSDDLYKPRPLFSSSSRRSRRSNQA